MTKTVLLLVGGGMAATALAAPPMLPPMRPNPEHFESRAQTSLSVVSPAESHYPDNEVHGVGSRIPSAGLGMRMPDAMSPDAVLGKEVVSASGKGLGAVEKVVRSKRTKRLNAVLSIDGFLGIGEQQVAIPVRDLEQRGDQLQVPSFANTQYELRSRFKYRPDGYELVAGGQ